MSVLLNARLRFQVTCVVGRQQPLQVRNARLGAKCEVPDCAPPTALDSCRVRHVALTTPPASRPHRQPSFASKAPEGALSLVDNEEVRRTGDLEGLWSACCGL